MPVVPMKDTRQLGVLIQLLKRDSGHHRFETDLFRGFTDPQ
jgi:hypothetical protein